MEENLTPGIASDGISGDIFGEPTGAAWDAAQLIFGNWLQLLFTDNGGDATIMSHVAGYMNFLAYILITVIIGYVLIASVIKTASEGKVMGNSWSTVWLPFRTFLACFFIFPIGIGNASTISFIQAFVAWLGMVGSNSADKVAEFVAGNLSKTSVGIGAGDQGYQTVANMVNIGFCNVGLYNGMEDFLTGGTSGFGNYNTESKGLENQNPPLVGASVTLNSSASAFSPKFMGSVESAMSSVTNGNTIYYGPAGRCGSISVNLDKIDIEDSKKEKLTKALLSVLAQKQIDVYNKVVLPLAGYVTATDYKTALEENGNPDLINNIKSSVASLSAESLTYQSKIIPIYKKAFNSDNNDYIKIEVINDVPVISIREDTFKDLGWAYLGAYYTMLSSATGQINSLSNSTEVTFNNPDGCSMTSDNGFWGFFGEDDDACQYTDEFFKSSLVLNTSSNLNSKNDNLSIMSQFQSNCGLNGDCDGVNFESYVAKIFIQPFVENEALKLTSDAASSLGSSESPAAFSRATIAALNLFGWGGDSENIMGLKEAEGSDSNSNFVPGALYISDPIAFTSNLGHTIVYSYNIIKSMAAIRVGVSEAGQNVRIPFISPILGGIGAALGYIVEYVMSVAQILATEGAIMAYFTPILPALIWAMAFLSWLLMYAEAIFNSPLAITLMATPEGEGIAGSRMERQISLLSALILKPVLLVVGMLLSMMLLNIGFVFLNQIFWMAAGQSHWVFSAFDILSVTAFISIWFSVIIIFMHSCFKVIPTFADNSLDWFLGGITRSFGNDFDGSTSSQFGEIASGSGKTGDMIKGTTGRTTELAQDIGGGAKKIYGRFKNNNGKDNS